MGITLFVLLFSIGMMVLLATLLKIEKIQAPIFAAGVALLVVFDFSLLSLDKIYFLHQEQDQTFLDNQQAYDERISAQLELYKNLTNIQLGIALQALSQNTKQQTEEDIQQKLVWRDQLLLQMNTLGFEESNMLDVNEKINSSVLKYLMESLNKQVRQTLGHRIYSEFVRTRPRSEWTDELFVKELSLYLNKQQLMDKKTEYNLKRLNEFKTSGVLIPQDIQPKSQDSAAKGN
ncbi:MAG: hypothetical protein ACI843_001762 [Psychrobacter glaciei]|jgi:hypothetical protein